MSWIDGKHVVINLDEITTLTPRFRLIPPFGVDGVRKTTTNRSELKRMTAHDFEDMLLVRRAYG